MKRLGISLFAAAMALLFAACNRRPDMVLGTRQMAELTVDLQLADAFAYDQRADIAASDSARRDIRRSVLAKHGINEAVLNTSLHWYGEHLPEYVKVIELADTILGDSLVALQNQERQAIENQGLADESKGEKDLRALPRSIVFAQNQRSDIATFNIPVDSAWKRGDVITLTLALHNAVSPVYATLFADYANRAQTTESVSRALYPGNDTRMTLKLQTDSTMNARRIYGHIMLRPAPGERAFVDSISITRAPVTRSRYTPLRRSQHRFSRYDY